MKKLPVTVLSGFLGSGKTILPIAKIEASKNLKTSNFEFLRSFLIDFAG